MLTIPVLSSSKPQAPKRGVLARLTRSRGEKPAAAGCDPAVFGEQIKAYLAEAAAKSAALEQEEFFAAAQATVDAPIVEPAPVQTPLAADTPLVVETPTVEMAVGAAPVVED